MKIQCPTVKMLGFMRALSKSRDVINPDVVNVLCCCSEVLQILFSVCLLRTELLQQHHFSVIALKNTAKAFHIHVFRHFIPLFLFRLCCNSVFTLLFRFQLEFLGRHQTTKSDHFLDTYIVVGLDHFFQRQEICEFLKKLQNHRVVMYSGYFVCPFIFAFWNG